jgi:hypothetical protein
MKRDSAGDFKGTRNQGPAVPGLRTSLLRPWRSRSVRASFALGGPRRPLDRRHASRAIRATARRRESGYKWSQLH